MSSAFHRNEHVLAIAQHDTLYEGCHSERSEESHFFNSPTATYYVLRFTFLNVRYSRKASSSASISPGNAALNSTAFLVIGWAKPNR